MVSLRKLPFLALHAEGLEEQNVQLLKMSLKMNAILNTIHATRMSPILVAGVVLRVGVKCVLLAITFAKTASVNQQHQLSVRLLVKNLALRNMPTLGWDIHVVLKDTLAM